MLDFAFQIAAGRFLDALDIDAETTWRASSIARATPLRLLPRRTAGVA